MSDLVLFEKRDGIAWVTMNRPDALNALDENMKDALIAAFARAEFDAEVRVMVLRGAGPHFQAGGDLASFSEDLHSLDEAALKQRFYAKIHHTKLLTTAIRRMPKPVIAQVHGQAVGFGLSLAIMCDFTIAAEDSLFSLAYVRIGNSPDGASSYYLPRIVGWKKATEIAMLGGQLSAGEAKDLGLVSFVVPPESLAEEAEKLAARLARAPTRALAGVKRLMHASLENSWEDQLQMEADCFVANVTSDDFREGIAAFMERRRSNFTGR